MSDLQDRLRTALRDLAGEAPPPPQIGGGQSAVQPATQQPASRVRRLPALATAAAIVACVSIWAASREDSSSFQLRGADTPNASLAPSSPPQVEQSVPPATIESASTPGSADSSIPPAALMVLPEPPNAWKNPSEVSVTAAGTMIVALGVSNEGAVAQVFDVASRAWRGASAVPELPVGAIGANAPGAWTGSELVYPGASFDPVTLSWRVQKSFDPDPNRRRWWALWTGDAVVYLPGGQTYKPGTDTWGVVNNTPPNLSGAVPVWTGTSIVASDGEAWFAYSPEQGTWTRISSGPTDPALMAAVWNGTSLIVSTTTAIYRFEPASSTWSEEGPSPFGQCVAERWLISDAGQTVLISPACGLVSRTDTGWERIEALSGFAADVACPVLSATVRPAVLDLCSLSAGNLTW